MNTTMQLVMVLLGGFTFAYAGNMWEDHQGIKANWGAVLVVLLGILFFIIAIYYDPSKNVY